MGDGLFNYLKKNTSLPVFWLECLRYELDQQIYFYGQQFKNPREGRYFSLKFKDGLKDLFSSIRLLNFFFFEEIWG